MTNSNNLSSRRISRIREQGYFEYSDQEIGAFAFGNRFAIRLCVIILIPAVSFAIIPLLIFMNVVAFSSIFLTNHPFDYIYNHLLRKWTVGAKLPPRSPQLRFACFLASCVIASTIYFFESEMMLEGYIMGFQLVGVASLVGLFDLCLPSKLYNFIVGKPGHFQA